MFLGKKYDVKYFTLKLLNKYNVYYLMQSIIF